MGGSRPSRTFRAFASLGDDNPSSVEEEREASNSPTRQSRTPHRPTELARPFARLSTGPPRFPNPHRVGRGLKRSHPRPVQALLLGKHATDLTPGATMGAPTTVTRGSVDLPFFGGRSRMPRSRRTFRGTKRAHVTVGLPLSDDTSSEQHARKLRVAFVPS